MSVLAAGPIAVAGAMASAVGYGFLCAVGLVKWRWSAQGALYFLGALAMTLWACASLHETLQAAHVIFLAVALAAFLSLIAVGGRLPVKAVVYSGFAVTYLLGCTDLLPALWFRNFGFDFTSAPLFLLATLGLLLACPSLLSVRGGKFWHVKHFWFGLILIFSAALMTAVNNRLPADIASAAQLTQGWVFVAAVPFLAVAAKRNPDWQIGIHLSRPVVLGLLVLLCAGAFVAIVTALLRQNYDGFQDGTDGLVLLLSILAVPVFAAALLSRSIRSALHLFVMRHFFAYRYDYRQVWNKFLAAMSMQDQSLYLRAVRAAAAIVDSPGGALWLRDDANQAFELVESWNMGDLPDTLAFSEAAARGLAHQEIATVITRSEPVEGAWHQWLSALPNAWLGVVCAYREQPQGLLVLQAPRFGRAFGWEERNLMETVSKQIAGYLAEEAAQRQLNDHYRVIEFNRRMAFAVHDIKSLTSQMSLLSQNAVRHRDNPDFIDDMATTIRHVAEKMDALVVRLKQGDWQDNGNSVLTALAPLLRDSIQAWKDIGADITLSDNGADVSAVIVPDALQQAVAHLILNALEAGDGAAGAKIHIRVFRYEGDPAIDISDSGPGMPLKFVHNGLFQPLRSRKGAGMGLGAYQARTIVNQMGGRLQVVSVQGQGTIMRLVLPATEAAAVPVDEEVEDAHGRPSGN